MKLMRKLERVVQILYWSFIVIFMVGFSKHDQVPLLPYNLTWTLLGAIATAIVICLVKYYFFSKRTK